MSANTSDMEKALAALTGLDELITAADPTAESNHWPLKVADMLRAQSAELASLRARCDAAEKDAARYRWIRGHIKFWEGHDIAYPHCKINVYIRESQNGSVEKFSVIGDRNKVGMICLDDAIDHVMRGRTEPAFMECPACHGAGGGRGIDGVENDCSTCGGNGGIAHALTAERAKEGETRK